MELCFRLLLPSEMFPFNQYFCWNKTVQRCSVLSIVDGSWWCRGKVLFLAPDKESHILATRMLRRKRCFLYPAANEGNIFRTPGVRSGQQFSSYASSDLSNLSLEIIQKCFFTVYIYISEISSQISVLIVPGFHFGTLCTWLNSQNLFHVLWYFGTSSSPL